MIEPMAATQTGGTDSGVPPAPGVEATGVEATGVEATGVEATGVEATGVEATGVEATGVGANIVRANIVGTGLFVVSSVLAAAVFTESFRTAGALVALTVFAIGIFAFLSSYWTAVQRSRAEHIAVSQLYFLGAGSAPRTVRRTMNGALLVQVVVALATAFSRTNTNGKSGSTLAFGVLVPMFGLGLNGLWCARHGTFAHRDDGAAVRNDATVKTNSRDATPSPQEREQNANQG